MTGRRTALAIAVSAVLAAGMPALSQDQGVTRPGGAQPPAGDISINRGRFIAIGGMHGEASLPCVQCHGLAGAGNSSGAFPRLADQAGWYLYKTLQDYAAGLRPNQTMQTVARLLTDDQMQDVAAYYASVRNAPYPAGPDAGGELLQIGAVIATAGLPEQGLPACQSCHGPRGTGNPPVYPYLAGQFAAYTEHQLHLWKEGLRDGDPMNVMELIAKNMTDQQIRAVALYFAALRPDEVTPLDGEFLGDGGPVDRGGDAGPGTYRVAPGAMGAVPDEEIRPDKPDTEVVPGGD